MAEKVQADGRVQRWAFVAEEQRYLRVVLLEDREKVHNAFFDSSLLGHRLAIRCQFVKGRWVPHVG